MIAANEPIGQAMAPALTDSPELEALLAKQGPLDDAAALDAWAASGAMWLTGDADGPALAPRRGLVDAVERLGRSIRDLSNDAALTTNWARPVMLQPMALLTERAAIAGLHRRGRISCGGAARLLRCADGRWIAVSLARPSDVESIPAWLEIEPEPEDLWDAVAVEVARRPASEVLTQGMLLALPVAELGERASADRPGVGARRRAPRTWRRRTGRPLVIDLSSLWAGPLCGHLLHLAGAEVIKVESMSRPDGARSGPAAFFDLLNAGKTMVSLDFASARDVAVLDHLLRAADVVIEASRPRALAQLGLTSLAHMPRRDQVWTAITAYGSRGEPSEITANRVGFGDDAAVAGGCVAAGADGPVFCADAIADPLAGLAAAATTLAALAAGGSWSLDVALSGVAAWASSGPQIIATPVSSPAAPSARVVASTAGGIGADNDWLERFERTQRNEQ